MNKRYCDDADCLNFMRGGECKLGFKLAFRAPKSYADINACNWGYLMSKACLLKDRICWRLRR